jgi:hypothetical protein
MTQEEMRQLRDSEDEDEVEEELGEADARFFSLVSFTQQRPGWHVRP